MLPVCGLSDSECDKFVEGVGEIIAAISDAANHTRVQSMQFNSVGIIDILALESDPVAYIGDVGGVAYIRSFDIA